jgi:D-amino-acid dehydrogenase
VIGLSTAWYLAERGHRVRVVDRGTPSRENCSYGNAGMLTPSHFVPLSAPGAVRNALRWMFDAESPFYVKPRLDRDLLSWGWKFNRNATAKHVEAAAPVIRDLNLAGVAAYQELARAWNDEFRLVERGSLVVARSGHGVAEGSRTAALANRLGVPAEVVSADQIAKLEPGIRMAVAGGVFYPRDAILAPALFMRALIRRLEERGVELIWNSEVFGWVTGTTRVVAARTRLGAIEADEFVVCGGSWSPSVVRDLGLRLPMQAGKGYSLTLSAPRERATRGIILTEARVAVTPMGDAMRFGGTMEIAGVDETINPSRIRGIVKSACRYFPSFTPNDFEGIEPWCGLRPCSPDGLPYIGRFARYLNLSAATGHAMMGLSLGPMTGKLMAEVIGGEDPSIPLDMLSPDRYA